MKGDLYMTKTKRCKHCSNEIDDNAKFCPECGTKIKIPFFKKDWFLILLISMLVAGGLFIGFKNEIWTIKENAPVEYKLAFKQARQFSRSGNMSKTELIELLMSENGGEFSKEEAQYAVDKLDIDWKKHALKSAQGYKDVLKLPEDTIHFHLITGGFTEEEAQYAIDNLE